MAEATSSRYAPFEALTLAGFSISRLQTVRDFSTAPAPATDHIYKADERYTTIRRRLLYWMQEVNHRLEICTQVSPYSTPQRGDSVILTQIFALPAFREPSSYTALLDFTALILRI